MRIGMVAPPWLPVPPENYGGTESLVDTLARALDAAGEHVVLVAAADSTCPVERRPGPCPATGFRSGAFGDEVRHVAAAYPLLDDCDVVHDHTITGPVYAGRPPGLPVATTVHNTFDGLRDVYRAAARTTALVAISRSQAETAGDIPVTAVIHHGLDLEPVPIGAGDGGFALFLGRMTGEKGPHEAVEIARAAGVPLVMAGKVSGRAEQEYFDAEIRPLLGGDVEFIGEIGGAEKMELIGRAVALLNPIRWPEPFGLVMVEALACGTPVLTYAEGAAPEIVDDGVTGRLCADGDDMAEALRNVEAYDRAGCRRAAEERFSSARMAADHVALYRALVDGRR